MNHLVKSIIAIATACAALGGAALADTFSFNGTVTAGATSEVYTAIGGTVKSVFVQVGDSVQAGDVIATLETEKVYATEAGVITGVFGEPGDNAETVSGRYGAVMYIEGESISSITASTDEAYSATANKLVHVGESVVLAAYSDSSRKGTGQIISIEGVNYNVRVLSGSFLVGETVTVYRDSVASSNRIGRGTLERTAPTAVTAQGSIVSLAVQDGDTVQRGDLLFETLSGDFDGLYMSGCDILAPVDGDISAIGVQQGAKIEKGSVAAVLYPADAMQVTAQVNEEDLRGIDVGDKVNIELVWNQDENITYTGKVLNISAIATETAGAEDSAVTYDVDIAFQPDDDTRYGMSAIITTIDGNEEDEADEEDADFDADETETEADENA